jgi:hypothetical protein
MRFALDPNEEMRALQAELRCAHVATPALMMRVLALAGDRLPALRNGEATRISALIDAQGWTDATLALLELGLPQWKLRRITYDDGEWHCCLGKQWQLPESLDEVVEVNHPVLPVALLCAFVQARSVTSCAKEPVSTVPSIRPSIHQTFCCDNFF